MKAKYALIVSLVVFAFVLVGMTLAYAAPSLSPACATPLDGPFNAAATCVQPPSNLVAWWPGDGNAKDIVGGNDGTLSGVVTFTLGRVGQAFAFDGTSGEVLVPHAP